MNAGSVLVLSNANYWVQGGRSAEVQCLAGGGADTGIQSSNIHIPLYCFFAQDEAGNWIDKFWVEAWVWHLGGNPVTLKIWDGAWVLPEAVWTAGEMPFAIEDDRCYRDNRWIRKGFVFDLSGTNCNRNINVFVGVDAADDVGGATQFMVDRIYLTPLGNLHDAGISPPTGIEVRNPDWMPRAWSSHWLSSWHDDDGTDNHTKGTECHYSYQDIEDVAGDIEAPARIEVSNWYSESNSEITYFIGRRTRERPWAFTHVIEGESGAQWGAGIADLSASNGERVDSPALTPAWSVEWLYAPPAGYYNLYSEGYFRLLARIKDAGAAGTLRMRASVPMNFTLWEPPKWLPEVVSTKPRGNNWYLLDLGVVKIPPLGWRGLDSIYNYLLIEARRTAGNQKVGLDYVYLMPVDEFYTEFTSAFIVGGRSPWVANLDHIDWENMSWMESWIAVGLWRITDALYYFTRLDPSIKPNTCNRFYFTELEGLYTSGQFHCQTLTYRESYL